MLNDDLDALFNLCSLPLEQEIWIFQIILICPVMYIECWGATEFTDNSILEACLVLSLIWCRCWRPLIKQENVTLNNLFLLYRNEKNS